VPFAERPGAKLWYEVYGADDAPTLVLAHGAGGNRISWWQQVPHFASHRRVVVFDHRCFGRSFADEFAPAAFADDLEAVLAAAGVDRFAIVCQSMGGWSGLPFALRHPDRVSALVLACTPGGYVDDAVLAAVGRTGERIRAAGIDHTPALGPSFARRRPDLVHLYDQIGALNTGVELSAVTRLFEPAARLDPADAAKLAAPTLALTGGEDLLFPPDMMEGVARALPGAECVRVDDAGHSIYFEQPERFAALVDDFLARRELRAA
jgi:3-oxoadipate enol-lactonase